MKPSRILVAAALVAALLATNAAAERPAASATLIEQLGTAIGGAGYTVAMSADGSRVAAGTPLGDRVHVYEWNGSAWQPVGSHITANANAVGLSADGDRLAIGSGSSSVVQVFDWNGTTWTQVGANIDGEAAIDQFGSALALSDDGARLAIGGLHNDGNGIDSGHARVYDWDGTTWTQVGTDIDGEAAGDQAGFFIAMTGGGDRIAVGAERNDGNGGSSGHVRVFDWDGASWTQVGADIDGEAPGDTSGESLAFSEDGTRLAIGAVGNDGTGLAAGHVRIFDWDGTTWTQVGTDIDGEAANDGSGFSIALSASGERVVIGAPRNAGNGTRAGHVRIFDWDGTTWTQAGTDIDGEAADDRFGFWVAISDDGARVAAGAGYGANQVRVFTISHEPGAPTATSAVAGDEQAAVSWTAPADDGGSPLTGYTATAAPGGQACSTTTTGCTVSGLTNGVTYTITVTAANAAGTSAASVATSVTPVSIPEAPTDVAALDGDEDATVSWVAPVDDGGSPITGYTATTTPGGHTCTTTDLTCTIDGLDNGTTYTITVTATNAIGSGAPSASATTTPATHPSSPRAVEAVASDRAITASWTAPDDDGGAPITGYTATTTPDGHTCTTTNLTCTIDGLDNGTTYTITVTATNRAGTSTASTSATATPTQVGTIAGIGHDCGQVGHHPFTDVPSRWDREISCLFELDITTGVTNTRFAPDRTLTREEAAAFLARTYTALTGKSCAGTHPFTDAPQTGWNGTAIACLWTLDLTTGTTPTTYAPTRTLTREELAAFISRLYTHVTGKSCAGTHPFTDAPQTGWNGTAIACLWTLDLTTGTTPTTYAPTDEVTRLQAAIFLSRLATHLT